MNGYAVLAFVLVAIGMYALLFRRNPPAWLVQEFPAIYNQHCFDCRRENSACLTCPYRRML